MSDVITPYSPRKESTQNPKPIDLEKYKSKFQSQKIEVSIKAILDNFPPFSEENVQEIVEKFESNISSIDEAKAIFKSRKEQKRNTDLLSSILHTTQLPLIIDTFKQSKAKRAGGSPTAIAVNKYIAVGTSRGVVFVYDHFQNLQMMFGTREGVEYGAVTSISISARNDRLIVGHYNGQIVLWDLN